MGHRWDRSTSGGDGIRTHCLYIANVALYQLSYTPEEALTLAQRPTRLGLTLPAVVLVVLFVFGLVLVVVAR
jgi:hypothetical protein